MKDKILDLIDKVESLSFFKGFRYSLTLNFENEVPSYKSPEFISSNVIKILNDYPKDITSFNLTLIDESPSFGWSEEKYNGYWYTLNFIFYGGVDVREGEDEDVVEEISQNPSDIKISMSFSSSQASLPQLEMYIRDVNNPHHEIVFSDMNLSKTIDVAIVYKRSTKDIFNAIQKLKNV
jgi:hypothetical protein